MSISFVLGASNVSARSPAQEALAIGSLALLVCRWAILNAGAWPPRFSNLLAWPMGILLTLSFVFLQLSRLRRGFVRTR